MARVYAPFGYRPLPIRDDLRFAAYPPVLRLQHESAVDYILLVDCNVVLAPDVLATEARRYPPLDLIAKTLGGISEIISVPIPLMCRDGFNEAYYGRPEMLLTEPARKANSAWSFVDVDTAQGYVKHLRDDIENGNWDKRFGYLRTQPEFDGSLRLVVSRP